MMFRENVKKKRDVNDPISSQPEPPEDDAVLLEDLAPREDVRGGSGKIPFGQGPAAGRPPSDKKGKRER